MATSHVELTEAAHQTRAGLHPDIDLENVRSTAIYAKSWAAGLRIILMRSVRPPANRLINALIRAGKPISRKITGTIRRTRLVTSYTPRTTLILMILSRI
jgi:hypothetical protein